MALKDKKRKQAASPIQPSSSSKRIRSTSNTTPMPFSNALPAAADYGFRLDVVCAPNVNDKIFEGAVHGLIQICFPTEILDELGVDIVAAHMEQSEAPVENLTRIREVWRGAMIHRVSWMLARYLDKPGSVDDAVSIIKDACRALHGELGEAKEEDDILSEVRASVETAASQPEKKKEKKKEFKRSKMRAYEEEEQEEVVVDAPNSKVSEPATAVDSKERRVSKTWRWDVTTTSLTADEITAFFKKTSDIFAFHALPIVQHELGPTPAKKEIRARMDSLLADMPEVDFKKWEESFQKLLNGDLTMLQRVSPDNHVTAKDIVRATPAPVASRQRHGKKPIAVYSKTISQAHPSNSGLALGEVRASSNLMVEPLHPFKSESVANVDVAEAPHLQPANHLPSSPITVRELPYEVNTPTQCSSRTPLVDLLWGPAQFVHGKGTFVVNEIMDSLHRRVTLDSIVIPQFDGSTEFCSREMLKSRLTGVYSTGKSQFRSKVALDLNLVDWAVASPAAFPEIIKESLFFVHSMTYITPVLDLVYGQRPFGGKQQIVQAGFEIMESLIRRGIPIDVQCGRYINGFGRNFHFVMFDKRKNKDDATKRGHIDRLLREIAFAHKDKFPELASSLVVRAWERMTGLKWQSGT